MGNWQVTKVTQNHKNNSNSWTSIAHISEVIEFYKWIISTILTIVKKKKTQYIIHMNEFSLPTSAIKLKTSSKIKR